MRMVCFPSNQGPIFETLQKYQHFAKQNIIKTNTLMGNQKTDT